MIKVNMLTNGEWYDGFLWKDGRQIGVATAKCHVGSWSGETSFTSAQNGTMAYKEDGRNITFEPSVVSIGEPAS